MLLSQFDSSTIVFFGTLIQIKLRFYDIADFLHLWFAFLTPGKPLNDYVYEQKS